MKITSACLCALLLGALQFQVASAQEAVTFGDDARYVRVQFVSYKPNKAGEAYSIINDHFAPAGMAAGLPAPVVIHFQSGPFDAAFHWRLENGMSDLEWRVSPNNVKFMESLAAREGGPEAARALMDRYWSLVARSVTAIGHRHVAEDEE